MKAQEFVRRSVGIAANGSLHSFAEMMNLRSGQPYPTRLAKVLYGKALANMVPIPQSIEVASRPYDLSTAGGQQIVFVDETGVAKVIVHSLSFDREYTEAEADFYQTNYDHAKPYMREHMTDTRFDLKRFRGGLFAALSIQPRIRADKEFKDIAELIDFRDDDPYTEQLQSLVVSLGDLYSATGLLMDLNGVGNVVLRGQADPRLEIVDTIVVSPEMQAVIDRNRRITTGETIAEKMNLLTSAVAVKPIALT